MRRHPRVFGGGEAVAGAAVELRALARHQRRVPGAGIGQIAGVAGDDVQVQVRHRLAGGNTILNRPVEAVGGEGAREHPRHAPREQHEGAQVVFGELQ